MKKFHSEKSRAITLREIETDHRDYWTGYLRGLRRAEYGERFGTESEHKLWLSLISDLSHRELGRGYRNGLKFGK